LITLYQGTSWLPGPAHRGRRYATSGAHLLNHFVGARVWLSPKEGEASECSSFGCTEHTHCPLVACSQNSILRSYHDQNLFIENGKTL
jgi:hypothetical protein